MKNRPFDYERSAKLKNYVRKRYGNQLNNGVLAFYFCAFPFLERKGLGLCQPITATYPELAKYGLRSISNIKTALTALDGVLCEVILGKPIKNGKEATQI